MISSIHLSHLHNAEFCSFMSDILTFIKKANKDLDLQKESLELNMLLEHFNRIWGKNNVSSYTQKVNELDKKRCASFTGMGQCLRGYTKHYDKNIKLASEIIMESIESMGKRIVYRNFQAKTSTFSLLLSAWQENPKFIEAIETLSMSGWVNHLAELNREFEEVFMERLSAQAAKPDMNLSDVRLELTSVYRMISRKVEAYCVLGNEKADALIVRMNRLIAEYNKELNRRKNKATKKSN